MIKSGSKYFYSTWTFVKCWLVICEKLNSVGYVFKIRFHLSTESRVLWGRPYPTSRAKGGGDQLKIFYRVGENVLCILQILNENEFFRKTDNCNEDMFTDRQQLSKFHNW